MTSEGPEQDMQLKIYKHLRLDPELHKHKTTHATRLSCCSSLVPTWKLLWKTEETVLHNVKRQAGSRQEQAILVEIGQGNIAPMQLLGLSPWNIYMHAYYLQLLFPLDECINPQSYLDTVKRVTFLIFKVNTQMPSVNFSTNCFWNFCLMEKKWAAVNQKDQTFYRVYRMSYRNFWIVTREPKTMIYAWSVHKKDFIKVYLYILQIGDSIVHKARETLERAIKLVNETKKWGARVVYGDTDR